MVSPSLSVKVPNLCCIVTVQDSYSSYEKKKGLISFGGTFIDVPTPIHVLCDGYTYIVRNRPYGFACDVSAK